MSILSNNEQAQSLTSASSVTAFTSYPVRIKSGQLRLHGSQIRV